jgi:hypothetical protein
MNLRPDPETSLPESRPEKQLALLSLYLLRFLRVEAAVLVLLTAAAGTSIVAADAFAIGVQKVIEIEPVLQPRILPEHLGEQFIGAGMVLLHPRRIFEEIFCHHGEKLRW